MGKAREAVPVSLTPHQRRELERLWFVFGNYGPKTTKGNHSFIQGMLERGQDERPLKQRGYMPTAECEAAVERVLHADERPQEISTEKAEIAGEDGEGNVPQLRVVHSETGRAVMADPALKELLDEMRQRRRANEVSNPDPPEAA